MRGNKYLPCEQVVSVEKKLRHCDRAHLKLAGFSKLLSINVVNIVSVRHKLPQPLDGELPSSTARTVAQCAIGESILAFWDLEPTNTRFCDLVATRIASRKN